MTSKHKLGLYQLTAPVASKLSGNYALFAQLLARHGTNAEGIIMLACHGTVLEDLLVPGLSTSLTMLVCLAIGIPERKGQLRLRQALKNMGSNSRSGWLHYYHRSDNDVTSRHYLGRCVSALVLTAPSSASSARAVASPSSLASGLVIRATMHSSHPRVSPTVLCTWAVLSCFSKTACRK